MENKSTVESVKQQALSQMEKAVSGLEMKDYAAAYRTLVEIELTIKSQALQERFQKLELERIEGPSKALASTSTRGN